MSQLVFEPDNQQSYELAAYRAALGDALGSLQNRANLISQRMSYVHVQRMRRVHV
jgi:hypothetical protein